MIDVKNVKAITAEAVESKTVVSGFGIYHILEDSYILVARFTKNGNRQRYYVSGPDIPYVLSKVSEYFDSSDFESTLYMVSGSKCVPLEYNNQRNVKCW